MKAPSRKTFDSWSIPKKEAWIIRELDGLNQYAPNFPGFIFYTDRGYVVSFTINTDGNLSKIETLNLDDGRDKFNQFVFALKAGESGLN